MDRQLPPGPDAGPKSPARLSRRALWTAIKQSVVEFDRDNAWDWAAALTYYGVLSIFPGMVVLVSIVGLVRRSALQPIIESLSGIAPGPVRTILNEAVVGLRDSPQQAGIAAAIGLVFALWSASGYAGAFIRAANASYDVPEGRPLWKTIPIRVGITVATGVLLVASAAIVLITGTVAATLGRALQLESTTVMAWNVVKWPVLVVLVTLMFALLYWASPNARQGGFRWVSPGGGVAVVLWMIASALFGLYASNFASYDKTYGTLAGVVIFLVWLWITNLALLLGLEINAELERQRAIAAGLSPDAEPYVRLRDERAITPDSDQSLADKGVRSPAADSVAPLESDPPAASQQHRRGRTAAAILGFSAGFAAALVITSRRNR